uniref:Uncharacterized protein n=1 Tax=Anolis carolinensis TaxID=28377 RepID=H9GFL3_ANOCA
RTRRRRGKRRRRTGGPSPGGTSAPPVLVGETQGSRRLARPVLLALRASVCLSTHRVFSAFLCSLFHTGESAVKRFLPKSHLSKVIIQDNASVQRVQDIKVSKRKVGSMLDHMKKTFLHDQQKKMARWRKEAGVLPSTTFGFPH